MADENTPKQFFHLRDIATKTVTLYPARAHIVREIKNITLQPGQNEIEVYGFATTIDEHSLQIEGTGDSSVTITDITVDQVPNKEKFSDLHDSFEEEISEIEDYEDSDDETSTVKHAKLKLADLQSRLKAVEDEENSAQAQLDALNNYLNSVRANHSDAQDFAQRVRNYDEDRKRITVVLAKTAKDKKKLGRERDRAAWQLQKAQKLEEVKTRDAVKAKKKERQRKLREKQERKSEIDRKNDELRKFFPDRVYRVVVRLETALDTPNSSRRSSIIAPMSSAEATEKSLSKPTTNGPTIGLSISYVTSGSYWVPRYDLNISSVQKTALITYRAEVRNATSETWRDAKVILSTSQTSYSGLEDKVPTMQAWQVTLNRYGTGDALMSNAEIYHLETRKNLAIQSQHYAKRKKAAAPVTAAAIFGSSMAPRSSHFRVAQETADEDDGESTSTQRAPPPPAGFQPDMTVSRAAPQLERGSSAARASRRGALLGNLRRDSRREGSTAESNAALFDEVATLNDQLDPTPLEYEESAWEDHGLTAAYELPGIRTLAPSSLGRRYKITLLNATNIMLNHIAVPKLKAAAFLRAKIKNPSASITLLKGNAGITLDGSFLGNVPLPLVSPNQVFNIPLGVDPAIQVSYPKPTLHRSTQGIFNKERAHVFSRAILISNTKNVPLDLLVLDQVPISQDERLRIEISQPRGLSKEGDSVRCGQPVNDSKKPWGKAVATFKKDGEIAWVAEIEKGQACTLKFEYEAKMPSSESMANA